MTSHIIDINNATGSNNVIVRLEQHAQSAVEHVGRISGFIEIRNLVPLITQLDLQSNPRNARKGAVTKAIQETIEKTPELLPFKSKGILLSTSEYEKRDRNRFDLQFKDLSREGILDGGHNTLAIGLHLLSQTSIRKTDLSRIKTWLEFKNQWQKYREELEELGRDHTKNKALLSIEILTPADINSEEDRNSFQESLLDICAARNNNVQLKRETLAHQEGYFEFFKQSLSPQIAAEVSWKTNSGGRIDPLNLIQLLWVPLGVIPMPQKADGKPGELCKSISGKQAYSSTASSLKAFLEVVKSPEVSSDTDGDFQKVIISPSVRSAFLMLEDVLKVYDYVYQEIGNSYNRADGKFGRIKAIKNCQTSRKHYTPYYHLPADYVVVSSFVLPFVFGLRALIHVDEEGLASWITDPKEFIAEHLDELVAEAKALFELCNFEPNVIGKSGATYQGIQSHCRTLLLEKQARQVAGDPYGYAHTNKQAW